METTPDALEEQVAALATQVSVARRQMIEAQKLARIGSWEWDIPNDMVWWSEELYRIYGLEPHSLVPSYERFLEYVHPDDRESVDARNRKAFEDHQPFEDIKRVVRADGREILMRTEGEVICADGQPVRMIGICEDVTDQVRAREADKKLAAAEALRHRAFEINDEIIQRLVLVAGYLERGQLDKASVVLEDTRYRAQTIADELLEQAKIEPGDLRRSVPAA